MSVGFDDRGHSIHDTATALNISPSTARRLIREGDLEAVRVSERRIIVMGSAIRRYLSRKTINGAAA